MKKIFLIFFYIVFCINLFAIESFPKIFIGKTEVYLGMSRKEIISNFGEPDSEIIDLVSVNDEFSSVKMDYCNKNLNFYYNKGDEEIHTIKTEQNFFLLLDNGDVITKDTSIKELQQLFSDIHKISDTFYIISFEDKKRTIITDDIYFYFGSEGKLNKIIITNDYF